MEEEHNPFSQLNYVYQCLDFMKIKHIEIIDDEVDDTISSYCFKFGKINETFISSYDSDFFQLINENVKIIRYKGTASKIITKKDFIDKYSILPELYADYKAMVGDFSDNIKGVKGIGHKTINDYGSIDTIINKCKIESKYVKVIQESEEILQKNYSLICLDDHYQIPFGLEEIEYKQNIIKTMDIIHAIGL